MAQILLGVNNIAKSPASILFGGSDGRAVRLNSGFYGDADGKAKQIFASDIIVEYHAEFECWNKYDFSIPSLHHVSEYRNINNYIKIINHSSVSNVDTIPIKMFGNCIANSNGGTNYYTAFDYNESITKKNPIFTSPIKNWSSGDKTFLNPYANSNIRFNVYFTINGIKYDIINTTNYIDLHNPDFSVWEKIASVNKTGQIIIPA